MTTILIIIGILFIFLIGLVKLFRIHFRIMKKHEFASEYRNKFVEFTNKYLKTYSQWNRSGNIDNELYDWLTRNVYKIQNYLGGFGIMDYIAPFQKYKISNYQIILNTIPKFRNGSIEELDINSVDDSLLRYIGYLEEYSENTLRNLKNPFVWFTVGFQEIISIPLFVLNCVGILSKRTVDKIMESTFYKILTGIIALITLLSGIVTIIQGKEKTIEMINRILGN